MRRLGDEKDVLLIAILEMKLKDVYEKGKVMERESRIEKEGN